jgi:hypothetical protein
MVMLMSFVLYVTPGGALMFFIFRFIKANAVISVARTDKARAVTRLEAARDASAVAQGTAREALAQTRQALEVARTIEVVDERVQHLTSYLVTKIEGDAPAQGAGRHARHALPGEQDIPAITGSTQEGTS